jgi:hypothetical protein
MKKLFQISLFLLGVTFLVILYRYYANDYVPNSSRSFYKTETISVGDNDESSGAEKVVKDYDYDNPVDEYESRPVATAQDIIDNKVETIISAVEMIQGRCEDYNSMLEEADERFVGAMNTIGEKRNVKDTIDEHMVVVRELLVSGLARNEVLSNFKELISVLEETPSISSSQYVKYIKSFLICRDAQIGIFIENFYENIAAIDGVSEEANALVIDALSRQITSNGDVLPDNLLFTINLLRLIAKREGYPEPVFNELEDIFERIAHYDQFYYEEFLEKANVQNPGFVLRAYYDEMSLIAEDLARIIDNYFSRLKNI